MSRRINLKLCLIFVVFIYVTSNSTFSDVGAQQEQRPATPPAQPEEKPAEQVYKNIQVMKGMPASRLMQAMSRLTQSLGVDCAHCHVPDALDKDDKPAKQTARKMFEMVRTINATLKTNRVTCYTCHRGQPQPASMPPAPVNTASKSESASPEIKPADANVNVGAILDQYIQALGGRAALERVTTRVMRGTLVAQGGMKAPLEVYEKAPNKTLTIFRVPHGTNQMGFEDYRTVEGLKLPFAIRRARPNFTWTYQFDEIKLNVPLDDSRFNKPAAP
ncbi:MAG: photosynthetic reaction center cytochrome c subunit family protein [Acidobacteria bacterium]|nr:photosynthetic reaction center cytochrome c subunit family protein [Acidobacteriota bacterium]